MNIELFDQLSNEIVPARIYQVRSVDNLPDKTGGWNFTWRSLYQKNRHHQHTMFFAISLRATPNEIEGMLMVELQLVEMVYMPNVEIAPHNIGKEGRYRNVAGCLLAYACSVSFTHGIGNYHGYLSFTSKTALIKLYKNRYGARLAVGHNMYFSPQAGKTLIKKYLDLDYDLNIDES